MSRRAGAVVAVAAAALALVPHAAAQARGDLFVPGGIGMGVFLEPPSTLFGDPMSANVEIVVDPTRVDLDSVKVSAPGFEPYRLAGPVVATRRETRGVVTLRYRYRLLCLRPVCRPPVGATKTFRFVSPRVSFRRLRTFGGALEATGELSPDWHPVTVASRLSRELALRGDVQARAYPPPAVGYRTDPGRLAWLLAATALVLAALGGALVWRALAPVVRARLAQRRLARARSLERALAVLRDAAVRGEPEAQRRALDALAVALGQDGDELVTDVRRLAWSGRQPTADDALAVASEVEGRIGEEAR